MPANIGNELVNTAAIETIEKIGPRPNYLTSPSAKVTLSVTAVSTPGGIADVLRRLSAGDAIAFVDRDMSGRDVPAFSLQKLDRTYVVRDPKGQILASTATFAEAWRRRPRSKSVAAL